MKNKVTEEQKIQYRKDYYQAHKEEKRLNYEVNKIKVGKKKPINEDDQKQKEYKEYRKDYKYGWMDAIWENTNIKRPI